MMILIKSHLVTKDVRENLVAVSALFYFLCAIFVEKSNDKFRKRTCCIKFKFLTSIGCWRRSGRASC